MKTSTPGEGVTDPTTVKRSVTPPPGDDDLDICTSPWQHSPWSKDNYPVPGMCQFHVKIGVAEKFFNFHTVLFYR